jgi:5-formyltetrahydrofolate cyclo-ligase
MDADFDWKLWRSAERARLIGERLAVSADRRQAQSTLIADKLDAVLDLAAGSVVSFYWPFKGEPDLREWIGRLAERGIRSALPVVTEPRAPMEFRLWSRGAKMERGIWNIPVPADRSPVTPDLIIAPLVGFDAERYRLGYGGGYFDRTLASLGARPRVIGVGYEGARLPTIHPQPHDIPMDLIITA